MTLPTSPEPVLLRGVALDMDGLLFDTEKLYWEVGDRVLSRHGLRFCKQLQQKMMGRVGVDALQQMVDFHQLDDTAESLLAQSDVVYEELLQGGVDSMPGLDAWIEELKKSKIPFGLATSSRRRFVDIIFEQIEWREELAFILTGDDVSRGKPDPEMYLTAAERLGIPANEMLVLEDSGNGCAAAVAAGAYTVAIPSEHTRSQTFGGVRLIASSLADERLLQLVR